MQRNASNSNTISLRTELRPMLRLAAPLVLAEIGWMAMPVVDTMMVGRIPGQAAEAIGAVSIGGTLFLTLAIFGMGLLLGLDTFVSQAFGAGRVRDCHRWLMTGVYVSLALSPLLMGLLWACVPFLQSFGIHPAVFHLTVPYLYAVTWSVPPLLLYFAFRRYLQGMGLVKPVTFALISANLVNVVGNWLLIYGHWGFPAMGVAGSGWATCISRVYLALYLFAYILHYDHRHRIGFRQTEFAPDLARLRRLAALGLPAGLQFGLEVAVFAAATALIGRLTPVSLAAHQIALNTASFTYMVPLGVGSAAAVRVGQALGRGDPRGASHAGWTALLLGTSFMVCAGMTFLFAPNYIARIYTADAAVIQVGASLLAVAAFFQLFDGLQAVATGALRGAGDTHTAMISHVVCYWLVGLPLGYYLCFRRGWGARGLWVGLCLALILIGSVLLAAWSRKVQSFARRPTLVLE